MNQTELIELSTGPYAVALNALASIAFGPESLSAMAMQRRAYDAFWECTEPCAHCGGMESKVDACPHCDYLGRLPRSPLIPLERHK